MRCKNWTIALMLGACLPAMAQADEAADLAQELVNPIADIVSVPFQFNFDDGIGPTDDGSRVTANFQPIIPISLGDRGMIVTRTIIPYIWQEDVIPGSSQNGFGDVLFSAWYGPDPKSSLVWGFGPVLRIPTFTDVSSDTWALGLGGVALNTSGPWTYGINVNHLWDIESDPETPVNATFLQPFVAVTSANAWTLSLQTETTYDWENEAWSVPINASLSKLVFFGPLPVSFQGGVGYWAESPENGPEGWRFRLQAQVVLSRN